MRTRSHKLRRAAVLVWVAFLLPVLIGFAGLCVDVAVIFITQSNLQSIADVASLSGVIELPDTTAGRAAATNVVTANDASAGGVLQTEDIEFGNWNPGTRSFTVAGTPLNALRVRTAHDTDHSNPLNLVFMPIFGNSTADVNAVAISWLVPRLGGPVSGGLVGMEWADVGGTGFIDGYDATAGPYGGDNAGLPGTVLSNGPMTVHGTPVVTGDARPGVSYTEATVNGNPDIGGTIAALTRPLDFAPVAIPTSITAGSNNNNLVTGEFQFSGESLTVNSNKSASMPAGNYYFDNFTVKGEMHITGPAKIRVTGDWQVNAQAAIYVDGPVEFYVEGNATLNGQGVVNLSQDPRNLTIFSTGDTLKWNGGSDFYGYLYSPDDAEITINGNADFYGGAVGRTLKISGTGDVHTENGAGFNGPNRGLPILVD